MADFTYPSYRRDQLFLLVIIRLAYLSLRGTSAGSDLLFQTLAGQVPSTLKSLTAVFGMGTGVASLVLPPALVPLLLT